MTLDMRLAAAVAAAAACLAGCGGGSDSGTPPNQALIQNYGSALASSSTAAGLAQLKSSFDGSFLDAGYTKAQVDANVDAEAAALGNAEYSLFPQMTLSDAVVSNCDAQSVCTLTGTLTNNDADTTSVPISVRVILRNGTYMLYGDQQNA